MENGRAWNKTLESIGRALGQTLSRQVLAAEFEREAGDSKRLLDVVAGLRERADLDAGDVVALGLKLLQRLAPNEHRRRALRAAVTNLSPHPTLGPRGPQLAISLAQYRRARKRAAASAARLTEVNKLSRNRAQAMLRGRLRGIPQPDAAVQHAWALEAAARLPEIGSVEAIKALWKPELKRRGIAIGVRGVAPTTDHPGVCGWWRRHPYPFGIWSQCVAWLNNDGDVSKVTEPARASASNGHRKWHERNHVPLCPMPPPKLPKVAKL